MPIRLMLMLTIKAMLFTISLIQEQIMIGEKAYLGRTGIIFYGNIKQKICML